MEPFSHYLNELQNQNRKNFASWSDLRWINAFSAQKAAAKRQKLSGQLNNNYLFKNTKLYHQQISEGCKLCGQGQWSCLFITNKCNAVCFYCPANQQSDEIPSSQNLNFENAAAYADYINYFGFKGVSFSGGEPLLFFDRTLDYLQTVRKKCAADIYCWIYTNGILADENKFMQLADAGLNEVRFDIGATNYRLDKIKFAKGRIPTITVEIPAVPEKKELIKQLLPAMIEAGVSHLNLHQLRLTKHNVRHLSKHRYTYIHAEQPIVLESELAALEILNFAHDNNLDIGINYCSFAFKNRFQKAGFRNIVAKALAMPHEVISEKGFVREYDGQKIGYKAWVISKGEKQPPNSNVLQLGESVFYVKKETALEPLSIPSDKQHQVETFIRQQPDAVPEDPLLFKIWQMERIEQGLREY